MNAKENNLSVFFDSYPDIMTVQQVRQALKIGRPAVYHLIATNQIRCFKIGNAYRIPKSSLIEYIHQSCNGGETV